jgi:hypothetical protein
MCLVLAPILGSYQVRQGRSGLVPGHDTFFTIFFIALTLSLFSGTLTTKKSRNCGSFLCGKQVDSKHSTAS